MPFLPPASARTACALSCVLAAIGLLGASVPVRHATRVPALTRPQHVRRMGASSPITHVVVLIQENRSVDNLFNGFPGADTVSAGYDAQGRLHQLQAISFGTRCSPSHSHAAFVTEFNNGGVNGWGSAHYNCSPGASLPDGVFAYVNGRETAPYWAVAGNYALADEVFQTNEGPSFPAHQYLIAAQAGGHGVDAPWGFAENGGKDHSASTRDGPLEDGGHGCSSMSPKSYVQQIDFTSAFPGTEGNAVLPCKDYQTIFDLAMAQGVTWRYYAHRSGGLWAGVDSVSHLWANPAWHSTQPETTVLTDIAKHQLPNIAYVTPSLKNSDHPHSRHPSAMAGPRWIASVVNAIGNDSYYWGNTTILIVWDDWGGWFDHAMYGTTMHPASQPQDPYEYGFRVPLVVISPYVRAHMVDHTQRTFDSVMSYIETTFALGNLGLQDSPWFTDDLSDMFDYTQQPLHFVAMPTS